MRHAPTPGLFAFLVAVLLASVGCLVAHGANSGITDNEQSNASFTLVYTRVATNSKDLQATSGESGQPNTLILSRRQNKLLCIRVAGIFNKIGVVDSMQKVMCRNKDVAVYDGSCTYAITDKYPHLDIYAGFRSGCFQDFNVVGHNDFNPLYGAPASAAWQYYKSRVFRGSLIPEDAVCWTFRAEPRSGNTKSLNYQISYRLLGVSSRALPENWFQFSYFTTQEMPVISNGVRTETLIFDPKAGDLITQLRNRPSQTLERQKRDADLYLRRIADRTNHGDGRPVKAMLNSAMAQAAASNRRVLLVFTTSWCGVCYDLRRYIDDPEIARIFGKYYVTEEIYSWERGENKRWENAGGDVLYDKYHGDGTIPFVVILSSSGKMLVNSLSQGHNVGMPTEIQESGIYAFLRMIRITASGITPKELSTLHTVLTNRRK
jgi:hypothetical protein